MKQNRNIEKENKFLEILKYYKTKAIIGINLITIALGIVGSYQYYSNTIKGSKLISVTLFSALKLYLFSPTIGIEASTSIYYEIAKWMAPFCTALGILKLLEFILRQNIWELFHLFINVNYVFGFNDNSMLLIRNLKKNNKKVALVTDKPLAIEQKLELSRIGVATYEMNIINGSKTEIKYNLRKLRLGRASSIVAFYEDDIINFSLLMNIMNYIRDIKNFKKGKEEAIICSIKCDDNTIYELITQYYKDELERNDNASVINLKMFSIAQLAAYKLFDDINIYKNNMDLVKNKKNREIEDLGRVNLIIAGLGSFGEEVLYQAMCLGILNPSSKMSVTIFDRDANKESLLRAKYTKLDKICDINFIKVDVRSDTFIKILDNFHGDNEPTFIAVCFKDHTLSLSTSLVMIKRFKEVTVATRIKIDSNVIRYINDNNDLYKNIYPFGIEKDIITEKTIINSALDEKAINFHCKYSGINSHLDNYQSERLKAWNKLDFLKKESNRVQASYEKYMKSIVKYLYNIEDISQLVIDGENILNNSMTESDKEIKEFLKRNPKMLSLVKLEHKRWCNFMFAHNYEYAKKEDCKKDMKTHYCLKEEWEDILEDKDIMKTAIYDIISIYTYLGLDANIAIKNANTK